jgi:hypothetical protein
MYAKLEPRLVLALDSEYKNVLWECDDETLNQAIRSDLTVHSAGLAQVAASSSQVLPMGDVGTGKVMLIRADREVRLTLNGGAEYVTIKPLASYKGFLLLHGEFTAVTAANQDASNAAKVEYCLIGVE